MLPQSHFTAQVSFKFVLTV